MDSSALDVCQWPWLDCGHQFESFSMNLLDIHISQGKNLIFIHTMATQDRHQQAPTPVRLPDDLKKDLKTAAEENDRSLNGEIVNRLRSTFKGKRKPPRAADPASEVK